MKRLMSIMLAVVLLAVGLVPALAQGTWNTGIDIQNLTGNAGALTIVFYDSTGGTAGSFNLTIDAWGALNFYLPDKPISDGQYSAVISSDVQVAATAGQANYDLGGADIYLGTSNPESTLRFPLVYRNHTSGKWNSKIIVQNASDSAQTVTLRLYSVGETTADATATASIPAYAYKVFDISEATYAAFGPYGSAVVEGTAPLAGVADAIRNPGTGKVNVVESHYRAFGSGQQGRDFVLPLVYKNYNLWTSGVNILNVGDIATTVTITYTNANPNVTGGPWVFTKSLSGNAMDSFYTPNHTTIPDGFYGSAMMSSSASDLAVVVSSQRYRASGAEGVAYEASQPTDATACVSLPVVHNRTSWKTGINILNMGDETATVVISYKSSSSAASATQTITIPPHSPDSLYMPSESNTTLGFYGAADIKSTNGQPLLINASHSRSDQGVGTNYVGVNYTCP